MNADKQAKRLQKSLDFVAAIEAFKGAVVLLVGLGVLGLLHHDKQELACHIIERLHLNPGQKYPHIFIELMSSITDSRLWAFAGLALCYSTLRFVEAYGLWKDRSWAEWLALLSGLLYVPIEVYEVWHKVTWLRCGALVFNLAVVGIVGYVLWLKKKRHASSVTKPAQA